MFYTYILKSDLFNKFYIGSTTDISRRLNDHNNSNTPSTKPFLPWKLIYCETFSTLHAARARERQIKSWKNSAYMIKTLRLDM